MEQALVVSPYEVANIVLIKAVTNLHPGVGRTGEVVDLPVQKDNLGFPIIYSSSIKGAMKSAFWQLSDVDRNIMRALFGPEPREDEKFTSAVAVLDAFTLAFPVRSLEGVYAFATCPLLLKRFTEYSELTGRKFNYIEDLLKVPIEIGKCLASSGALENLKSEAIPNKLIINEEIDVEYSKNHVSEVDQLEGLLDLKGRLILLNDDDAAEAIRRSLVRITRIHIEREKKTVATGGLWDEEYVPWGTIFATALLYSKSKKSDKALTAQDVKDKVKELLDKTRNFLIIGGNETIGRGIVKLELKD